MRVKGGGHTSQIYAIRQAIAKALVSYYAKYIDAWAALDLKKKLVTYDRTLLIADPRRMEPKKFGGGGARARRQKRCVIDSPLRHWLLTQYLDYGVVTVKSFVSSQHIYFYHCILLSVAGDVLPGRRDIMWFTNISHCTIRVSTCETSLDVRVLICREYRPLVIEPHVGIHKTTYLYYFRWLSSPCLC